MKLKHHLWTFVIPKLICLLPKALSSKIFESETDFQLKVLETISLGCNFHLFLTETFTTYHENLINHIHQKQHQTYNAIHLSLILPIGFEFSGSIGQSNFVVRNNLSTKNDDPNSYHFHTLRNLEVSKCSFNVVSNRKKFDWRKLKNHVWFNECFSRNPCYHFTISASNEVDLMPDIAGSINVAMNLFQHSSPIHHFVLSDLKVLKVCSSSTLEVQTVVNDQDSKTDGKNAIFHSTAPCSSPRVIRFANFDYIASNFNEMFDRVRSKDRRILSICSTTEVFWHFELALKLNASLRVLNVTIPPELIDTLFHNVADISLGFPYNPGSAKRSGYSSQPIALDQFIFFTRLPFAIQPSMDFLVKPYHSLVWLGILASVIISAAFTFTVTSLQIMRTANYLAHLRWPLILLVEQSQTFHSEVFRRSGVRLILGVWLFCGIVFTTTYKGRLISILLNPELDMPPRTFEQLLNHPEYVIYSPGYPNQSGLETDLRSSGTPTANILVDRIQGLFSHESLLDCLFQVQQPEIACIGAKFYYTNLYKARTQDRSESYMQSTDPILSVAAHITVQKNSPLQKPLDNTISYLVDSGIGRDFWNRIVSDYSDFFKYDTKLTESYKPQRPINSYDKPLIRKAVVLQYLRLQSVALALACVVFGLEKFIHWNNRSIQSTVNDYVR